MRIFQKTLVILLLTVFVFSAAEGQERERSTEIAIAKAQKQAAEDLQSQRDARDRAERAKRVRQLATQAAALRSENNFVDAAKVDAAIREICRDYDPRFIRANDLKQRAAMARLNGEMLDANMFEREADRVFAELDVEYRTDAKNQKAGHNSESELQKMQQRVAAMVYEITRLKTQLAEREQRLAQYEKRRQ